MKFSSREEINYKTEGTFKNRRDIRWFYNLITKKRVSVTFDLGKYEAQPIEI